jgi:hypothetical protein
MALSTELSVHALAAPLPRITEVETRDQALMVETLPISIPA